MAALNKILFLSCIVFTCFLSACEEGGNDPDKNESSENNILSFTFSGLTPEVTGTINQTTHSVLVEVPNGTDVTALVPTIVVSEDATVNPASGVAKDFTIPVIYMVTAEDGSEQFYGVTVEVAEPDTEDIVATYVGSTEQRRGRIILITGGDFGDPDDNAVAFVSVANQNETPVSPENNSDDENLYAQIPEDLPLGDYTLKLYIGNETKTMDVTLTVGEQFPRIEAISTEYIYWGEDLTITGAFAASGNGVYLVQTVGDNVNEYSVDYVSESATSIVVTVPDDLTPGYYSVYVFTDDDAFDFANAILYVDDEP